MNAIRLRFDALPAQRRFLDSRARFAGLFGGIGSGKTVAGCVWAIEKACNNPRSLGLVGANSYRQLQDATLRTLQRLVAEGDVPHEFSVSDLRFRLGNGAEILCRSMDNYDSLRGVELGWFYLDELRDTRLEAWRVVQGRLRSPNVDAREGRVTSTPNGFGWIYDEFVRKPADPAAPAEYRGNYEAFFARTADNCHLPPDYLAALLASYDPLLAAQELEGRFVNTTAGRVYHAFDRAAHVTPEAELVPGQPIFWALDFNVSPMTAVIAQWEPTGRSDRSVGSDRSDRSDGSDRSPLGAHDARLRVVDELWLTNSGTLDMCEAFGEWLERASSREPRAASHPVPKLEARGSKLAAVFVFGDAAGGNRSTVGPSDYALIRQSFPRARLCVPAANPPRRDRYNAVNAALRDARGRVRLRIHPRCRRLIDDLEQAVYQPGTGIPDTSSPERGHVSDALGYLVVRLMPAGRAGVRVGKW